MNLVCIDKVFIFVVGHNILRGVVLMKLSYDVSDRPGLSKTLLFAFQQMIAIMAATLLVPMLM